MKWKQYKGQNKGQKFDDNKIYMICYIDLSGKKRYDKASFKNGKPFVVGNYFAFDLVKEIRAFIEIEEYND